MSVSLSLPIPPIISKSTSEPIPGPGTIPSAAKSDLDLTSTTSQIPRPPTLHFPSLHLGSFDTLNASPQPFATSPLSPVSSHHTVATSASSNGNGSSPSRRYFDARREQGLEAGPSRTASVPVTGDDTQSDRGDTRLSVEPSRSTSHSSRSSHRLHRGPVPPPLPPPTMALPPLPVLSPISPIGPPSPMGNGKAITSTMFRQTSSTSSSSSSLAQQPLSGARELPTVPPRGRALGHSLTISIPGPPTPMSERSPVLKNSPGIARRRTVIENNGNHHASPVKLSGVAERSNPPRDSSPTPEKGNKSYIVERGSIMMPQPMPTMVLEEKAINHSPRRLEKKRSSADLKTTSPTSPSAKRSLPKPPTVDPTLSTQSSTQDLPQATPFSSRLQTATDAATAPHTRRNIPAPPTRQDPQSTPQLNQLEAPRTAPVPSSSWPPLNVNKSPTMLLQALPVEDPTKPVPSFYQKHQANKSASSLPVVPGLADAGPYSGAAVSKTANGNGPNGVGIGRPTGQPAAGPSRGPSGKPMEEVCLECMMRDRDLADVDVQGEGVWERASDADRKDLEWREQALLKSMGDLNDNVSISNLLGRSMEDSSVESDSTDLNPPSTGNSAEDVRMRRATEERKKRKLLIFAKRREADWRVVKEVGWRGFTWEEGDAGEGLPRGFRGSRGGRLTEEGIKAVMTKFPSASAHRYQTLQTYLRQQWHLVLEVRAEAQRLGRFPFPDDIVTSSSTVSSHEGQSVPRGSSNNPNGAEGQFGGAFTPVRKTPALSIVRPSPSSPANLTGLASAPPRAAPLQRPLTQFIPDREPSVSSVRTPLYNSPVSSISRPRHGIQDSSPRVMNGSPPRSGTYEESNEELWSPDEASGGNLRPFSFAVRAGAAAARDGAGSDGHGGRRSLWGRFGGSVTSLFGGSHNGSGSMMDMHLGLDSDRRNRSSSVNVNNHPRAVSLASPTRPSFFSRDSRCDSVIDGEPQTRVSRVISHSRLSQMRLDDDYEEDGPEEEVQNKKKGIKGFFKKMKPKNARSKKSEAALRQNSGTMDQSRVESETPLAPPPPLSYLVGNRKHTRERSGSSSSMLTDGQDSSQGRRYSASSPYGNGIRSVSAPMNVATSSSGGSLSASPTSSKFATSGPKRESYASARRQSVTLNDMGEEMNKRGSGMEMLSNGNSGGAGGGNGTMRGMYASPEATMIYDEPSSMYRSSANGNGNGFRPHNKTTSSLSNSSGTMAIETPPPAVYTSSSFFNQQMQANNVGSTTQYPGPGHGQGHKHSLSQNATPTGTPIVKSPSGPLSPNRFKNLPPLPPAQGQGPGQNQGQDRTMMKNGVDTSASPDSFAAAFPDQEIDLTGTVHDPRYFSHSNPSYNQQYSYSPAPMTAKVTDYNTPLLSPGSGRYQSVPAPGTAQSQPQSRGYPGGQNAGYGYPQPQTRPQHQHQQQSQPLNSQGYPSAHARAMATGRASFDQLTPRGRGQMDQRAVKTMYGQPLVSDLGVMGDGGIGLNDGTGMGTVGTEKKKKGFKGFFGGSRAGRMA